MCRKNGRFEAHLQMRGAHLHDTKRRSNEQVYLGVYSDENSAAKAFDRAALKFYGQVAQLNVRLSSLIST